MLLLLLWIITKINSGKDVENGKLFLTLHELRKVEFMKSHQFGHWLAEGTPTETTKQYPLGCDAIDDKQSVTLSSLLFLLLSVVPLQALLSL